jgi:hypothetical protein
MCLKRTGMMSGLATLCQYDARPGEREGRGC